MYTHPPSFCIFLFNTNGCLSVGVCAFAVTSTTNKASSNRNTAKSKSKNSGGRSTLVGNLGFSQTPLLRTLACHRIPRLCPLLTIPLRQRETRVLQAWAAYLFSLPLTRCLTSFSPFLFLSPEHRQEENRARLGGLLIVVYLG